jgi:hypothetical protein
MASPQTQKNATTKTQHTQHTHTESHTPNQAPKLSHAIMEQLESLPKTTPQSQPQSHPHPHPHTENQEKQCPICMEDISPQSKNYSITPCGHEFCFSCLNTSLITNNTCPCCRHPLEKEKREKSNKINEATGIELIKEAMNEFPMMDYIRPMDAFQEPDATPEQRCFYLQSNLNMMMRAYSLNLMEYVRNYQELGEELFDGEDEDEDEDEDYDNET